MDDITEEKNASLKLERYNERLRGLHKIDRAILEQLENNESVNSVALSYLSDLTGGKQAKVIISRIWGLEKEQSLDWLVGPLK